MTENRASRKAKSARVFGHASRPAKTPFRVGLYARVSTQDQQTIPLQTRALREYAARRGWTITMQVREVGSGAAQRQSREKLLEAARRREIDRNGQCLGRPPSAGLQADQVQKLYGAGASKAEIARRLRIGRTSVRRILAAKEQ